MAHKSGITEAIICFHRQRAVLFCVRPRSLVIGPLGNVNIRDKETQINLLRLTRTRTMPGNLGLVAFVPFESFLNLKGNSGY